MSAAVTQTVARAKVELDYQRYQKAMFDKLAQEQAVRGEDVVQRETSVSCRASDPRWGGG